MDGRNYPPFERDFDQFVVDMYLSLLKQVGAVNQNVEHKSPLNCFLVSSFHPFLNLIFFVRNPCVPVMECDGQGR